MMLRVKEILREKGMTSKQLAMMINMTESGLSIALSEKGNPTLSKLEDIAKALGVPVEELFCAPKSESETFVVCPKCGIRINIKATIEEEHNDCPVE